MAGPKLLDKRIVNIEVAAQKKQQIDEGLRIASKVDAVRETLGAEEVNLEKFRTQTITKIQKEIDIKIKERDSIFLEVIKKEEQVNEHEKGLSKKENELKEKEQQLFTFEEKNKQRESRISKKEQECSEDRREAFLELRRARDRNKQAEKAHADAYDAQKSWEFVKSKAQALLADTQRLRKETEKEVYEKRKLNALKENSLILLEKDLKKREKELEKEKINLKDRENMFQRNLKRFNK